MVYAEKPLVHLPEPVEVLKGLGSRETKAEIIVVLAYHYPESVAEFRKVAQLKKVNVFIAEMGTSRDDIEGMLKGTESMDSFIGRNFNSANIEFGMKYCPFLKELHKNGVFIDTVDPYMDEMHQPETYGERFDVISSLDAEGGVLAEAIRSRNFELYALASDKLIDLNVKMDSGRNKMRVDAIADGMANGKYYGTIAVEGGPAHLPMIEQFLKHDKLKDVKVGYELAGKKELEKQFGEDMMNYFDPKAQVMLKILSGSEVSQEEKKLQIGRNYLTDVIFAAIETETRFPMLERICKANQLADKITSFEEAKELAEKIGTKTSHEALEILREHVKNKSSKLSST